MSVRARVGGGESRGERQLGVEGGGYDGRAEGEDEYLVGCGGQRLFKRKVWMSTHIHSF